MGVYVGPRLIKAKTTSISEGEMAKQDVYIFFDVYIFITGAFYCEGSVTNIGRGTFIFSIK